MYDQVHGRELPQMEDWSERLIAEAIACKVQFGVLILGRGSVVGHLLEAHLDERNATIHVTYDPRNELVGTDQLIDMRNVGEIPYPANEFSLMQPPEELIDPRRLAARRALRHAMRQAELQPGIEGGSPHDPHSAEARQAARRAIARARAQADPARVAPLGAPLGVSGQPLTPAASGPLSPMRRRVLLSREA